MNDYLWDKSGEADPEVERLEKLLGRFAHDESLREETALGNVQDEATVAPAPHSRWGAQDWRWLAAAAVVTLALITAGTLFALRFRWRAGAAWEIASVTGAPTINGRVIDSSMRLDVGEELRTDSRSRATVRIARIGVLDVAPGSRVRLIVTERNRHRIQLDSGSVSARVWAPPFVFAVRTPAGQANDIGCAFNLRYDDGGGVLRVTSGWVDFDGRTRSALVPAGAISELREEPGTPFYPDAAPAFIAALRQFDAAREPGALHQVLTHARRRDAMTLLHLLDHSSAYPQSREALFDRLRVIAPPPPTVTREMVLRGDHAALDRWRTALGLGGVKKWWLHWRDALPAKEKRSVLF